MLRRMAIVGAAAALGFAMLGVPVAEAAAPVNASGTLDCAISGKAKIAPPLTFGGSAPSGSLFIAKVTGTCTGSSGVTSVKGNLTTRLPTNDCAALAESSFPAANFGPVKYKGSGNKFTGSTTKFSTGGTFTFTDPITLSLPGAGTSSVASGSFVGQSSTMTLVFDQQAAGLGAACAPKQKGVKGSGGLKKLSFGGASSYEIS